MMTAVRRTARETGGRCMLTAASTAPCAGSIRTLRLCFWACSRTWDLFRRRRAPE